MRDGKDRLKRGKDERQEERKCALRTGWGPAAPSDPGGHRPGSAQQLRLFGCQST